VTAHPTPRAAARRPGTLPLAAVVCAATALAVAPSPVLLRSFVAVPVLVLVAGHHGATLVLGHPPRCKASADGDTDLDGLLRTVLPVLLGMLSLMTVVLLLGVSGIPIATTSVAVGTGSVALVLLLIARWRVPRSARMASGSLGRSVRGAARRAVRPAVAVLVLSAAVAGAVALRPVPVERYTQLALDEPDAVAGRQLSALIGTPVTLRWTLRGYGSSLPDTGPAVDVTVGQVPALGLRTDVGRVEPGTAPGVVAERRGTVTFTAPATAGLYDVRVTIRSDTPLLLVVGLKVTT
jgi:hypothetical protein